MATTPPATTNWGAYGAAFGAVSSVASAIGSSYAQSSAYKVRETQAKTQAMLAELQGDATALDLLRRYNKGQATDAVMSAAQNRSGGSVNAIANAASEQLNWDTMFAQISTGITVENMLDQSEQYALAAKASKTVGMSSAIASGAQQYGTSLYSIGGSTKKDD